MERVTGLLSAEGARRNRSGPAMHLVIGVWLGFAGLFAWLAGFTSMLRVRRLRRHGTTAWAMVVQYAADRTALQFTLDDGRVVEQLNPEPLKGGALKPGEKILVWYDPADPADILVYGRYARRTDKVFIAAGSLLILVGAAIAAFAR
jgi:hypothetical protein